MYLFCLALLASIQAPAASAGPRIPGSDTTAQYYAFKKNRPAAARENEKNPSTHYAWLSVAAALATGSFMATVAGNSALSFVLGILGGTAAIIFYQKHKRYAPANKLNQRKKGWNILINVGIALALTFITMAAVIGLITMLGE